MSWTATIASFSAFREEYLTKAAPAFNWSVDIHSNITGIRLETRIAQSGAKSYTIEETPFVPISSVFFSNDNSTTRVLFNFAEYDINGKFINTGLLFPNGVGNNHIYEYRILGHDSMGNLTLPTDINRIIITAI